MPTIRTTKIILLALITATTSLGACRRKSAAPPTAEAALTQLQQALTDGDKVQSFELLDQESRWSLMSIRRGLMRECELIRANYPAAQQAREVERCRGLEANADEPALLMQLDAQHGFFSRVKSAAAPQARQESAGRVDLEIQGARYAFCAEDSGFRFCGLRQQLEALKIKGARDLQIVEENVRAFRAGK